MFVFVILHYLAEEMTIECIEKIIQNCAGKEFHIVIVDNASANKSGERLFYKYRDNKRCTVLLNKENLGFANGNNVGYLYAKEKFNPSHIIVMNNDVLIEDKSFLDKIENIYYDTLYDVLGPDIRSCANGMHQNPMKLNGYTKTEIYRLIKKRKIRKRLFLLFYIKKLFVNKLRGVGTSVQEQFINERIFNPVLHGACFVFSGKFIKNETEAFNKNTFMFMEEDILHFYCMNKGYTMVYDPSISVYHMEDVATNIEYKTAYKKAKIKEKFLLESTEVLYRLMNEVK